MKLLILFVFFFQCSEKVNYKTFEELVSKHPSSFSNNYFKDKSWVDRIYNIDDIHIDYVMQMNKIDGFKELPTKTKSLNSEKEKFNSISKTFSKELNSMIEEYVYAIYFCENLGGSGLTGYIYDQDTKKPKGGFIILDSKVLNKNKTNK